MNTNRDLIALFAWAYYQRSLAWACAALIASLLWLLYERYYPAPRAPRSPVHARTRHVRNATRKVRHVSR